MGEEPDYILELGGRSIPNESADTNDGTSRPYISVLFECCSVYSRVYKNRDGSAYVGWCPKCAHKVSVKVGSGGTSCRFFRAS